MSGTRGAFTGGRGSSRAPLEAVDRSKQSCVFFAQGKCTKGDACPFSHASPLNDATGQAVSRGIGPDNEQKRAGIQGEYTKPVSEQPFEAISIGRNDDMHEQIKDGQANGTVAFRGAAVRSNEERAPGMQMSGANLSPPTDVEVGPGPFSAGPPVVIGGDGKTYVVGPEGLVPLDAVMRTMASTSKENSTSTPSSTPPNPTTAQPHQRSTLNDSNDRARVTVASNPSQPQTLEKASGKSGIITLPDGGFVTRKRAAKMKLLDDVYGEKDFKCVRERNAQEQSVRHERRLEKTEGRATVQAGGRPSIMDRLGPAKQPPGTATSAEKVVAPPRTRSEAPGQPAKMREEPRQPSTLVDRLRDGSQVNRPFPLSRPKSLGTARPTRRLDESAGQTALPRKPTVARPTVNHNTASLDFKVPTLDEIKSRKRKAEKARVEETAKKTTKIGYKVGTDTRSADSKVAEGTDVPSANVDRSHGDAVVPIAYVAREEVSDAAPTVDVSSDALQLEADMLEFQEWL